LLAELFLRSKANGVDEEGTVMIKKIKEKVVSMNSLIENVLEYAKAGTGKAEKTIIDFQSLIMNTISGIAVPQHIKIDCSRSEGQVYFNETFLRQIMQNLIDNAIKYNDKKEGKVEIGLEKNIDRQLIWVRDNGQGIIAKNFQKVFEMFKTAHDSYRKDSTGVGLSIVKRIIETNGGEIWFESVQNEGTTFYFTLPSANSEELNQLSQEEKNRQ
jgi:signal transduction histidine kinase